jgi:hypothetical protein
VEIGGDMDRATLKLIASGKYLDLNKSYNQEQHTQFIEGALFTFDLITASNRARRENAAEKELQRDIQQTKPQDVYSGPNS